jgi:hypothetical protein
VARDTSRPASNVAGHRLQQLAGLPGELLLYLFGRQRAAQVEVSGPREAVEALERARFGM